MITQFIVPAFSLAFYFGFLSRNLAANLYRRSKFHGNSGIEYFYQSWSRFCWSCLNIMAEFESVLCEEIANSGESSSKHLPENGWDNEIL